MPELNQTGCCSPFRLLEPKKSENFFNTTLTGDTDGINISQKGPQTSCLQKHEHFETSFIQRNGPGPIAHPHIGCTNNRSAVGEPNGHKYAKISSTAEVRDKSVFAKVYRRKLYKRPCSPTIEYFQGQSSDVEHDASHFERTLCTKEDDINACKITTCNWTSGREICTGDCKLGTAQVREKCSCTKMYYRKKYKRHHCNPAIGYFRSQSADVGHDSNTLERKSCTKEDDITTHASKTAPCNLTPGREIECENSQHVSILKENELVSSDKDCTDLSFKRPLTRYSQTCEKLFDMQLIQRRNDTQPIAKSQNACTNNMSNVEYSNNCKNAGISGSAEVGEKSLCMKVYYRKSYKRPRCGPVTGYFKGQSANRDHDASNSERSSSTTDDDVGDAGKIATSELILGKEIENEKRRCISTLKEDGRLTDDRDGTILSQKWSRTSYPQICEELSGTKLCQRRNDPQAIANSQVGCTNNGSAVENSNNHKYARMSGTAEEVREKRVRTKVYYRKNYRRPQCGSAQILGNGNHDSSNSGKSCTTEDDIADAGMAASCDLKSGREIDSEKSWCISILKENGLLGHFTRRSGATEYPAVVGDGIVDQKCKICHCLEDKNTLICDMCEESYHISCMKPKVNPTYAENWHCTTCNNERRKYSSSNSQNESKYSYLLRQMLDENVEHTMNVRIGSKYQAEIPEYVGINLESFESLLVGVVVSLEEKILEKEFSEEKLKNNIWEKDWKPATSLPPGSKENWLQCTSIIYKKGQVCPDGRKARRNIYCRKWRRAPLTEVQSERWDCSCAVVWDPHHADCSVPQELETAEIQRRMRESKEELETAEIQRSMRESKEELETAEIQRRMRESKEELETAEI